MTNGHRIPQDAGDTVRDIQRRLIAQERRPGVPNVRQYIGNGISPQARHIIDWNDINIFQNGWYYSEELSINGPDQESAWIGQVIVAKGGHGIMQVWQHAAGTAGSPPAFVRSFHYHGPPEPPEFSPWTQTSSAAQPDTDWIYVGGPGGPLFQNGWTNYDNDHTHARFRRRNGIVYVQGLVRSGVNGATIFVLPPYFCPSGNPTNGAAKLVFNGVAGNNTIGRVDVHPGGGVMHASGDTLFFSLSNITFPQEG